MMTVLEEGPKQQANQAGRRGSLKMEKMGERQDRLGTVCIAWQMPNTLTFVENNHFSSALHLCNRQHCILSDMQESILVLCRAMSGLIT
jgi:nicotinamide mononucleotide (NMN) deamidase PncC